MVIARILLLDVILQIVVLQLLLDAIGLLTLDLDAMLIELKVQRLWIFVGLQFKETE
jgi:hypothetical protein